MLLGGCYGFARQLLLCCLMVVRFLLGGFKGVARVLLRFRWCYDLCRKFSYVQLWIFAGCTTIFV